jgi:hypothetical protein
MAVRVPALVVGAVLVAVVLRSATRTVILPRATEPRRGLRLDRIVFLSVRVLLNSALGPRSDFERRDRVMAVFAPVGMLALLGTWLVVVVGAYTAMFWALAGRSLRQAFYLSGSSAFTLGFDRPSDLPSLVLTLTEATIALLLLALLITYLPTLYAAFSRRESAVASLETRAGSPPSAVGFLIRLNRISGLDDLTDLWERWEWWFVDVQETHSSFPPVAFFRSPIPKHSWVTAAGCLLDTAAIVVSALDRPPDPAAQLCLRAGWLSLRRVASVFGIPFDPDPQPTAPISITRHEFDDTLDRLERAGIPLKPDRDQAWRDYAGWRVNYDSVLLDLSTLTVAPPAAWTSDRLGSWHPWWVGRAHRSWRSGPAPDPQPPPP